MEEEECIEMPEGWGTTETEAGGNLSEEDEEVPPIVDLFADSNPQESFQFEVRRQQNNGDDDGDGTTTIRLSGFKLDSDESARSTGVTLWGAAPRLSRHLAHRCRDRIAGKRVLELGAGLGLPGIVAHHLGAAQVVLTDLDSHAMRKMRENVDANRRGDGGDAGGSPVGDAGTSSICCRQLKWGAPSPDHPFRTTHGTFDTILAADVIYVQDSIDPLFDTATMLMKDDGQFVLCWITRWNNVPEEMVLGAARARGLSCKQPDEGIYVFERKGGETGGEDCA